jgi:hypothetical protein
MTCGFFVWALHWSDQLLFSFGLLGSDFQFHFSPPYSLSRSIAIPHFTFASLPCCLFALLPYCLPKKKHGLRHAFV